MMKFNNPFLNGSDDEEVTTNEGRYEMNDWDNGEYAEHREDVAAEVAPVVEAVEEVNVEFEVVDGETEWITMPELARILGVAPNTAQKYVRQDGLEVSRLGRGIKVRKSEVSGIIQRRLTTL